MTNISIEKNADSINAIVRAVKVLDILSESSTPLGVSALAKKLDLPKVTTFRILNTLLLTGLLQKDSSDMYYLAPKFIIYGDKVKASFTLGSGCRTNFAGIGLHDRRKCKSWSSL